MTVSLVEKPKRVDRSTMFSRLSSCRLEYLPQQVICQKSRRILSARVASNRPVFGVSRFVKFPSLFGVDHSVRPLVHVKICVSRTSERRYTTFPIDRVDFLLWILAGTQDQPQPLCFLVHRRCDDIRHRFLSGLSINLVQKNWKTV